MNKSEWIDVRKELPNKEEGRTLFLTYHEDSGYNLAYFHEGDGCWCECLEDIAVKVWYYMRLPEPPIEEADKELERSITSSRQN